MRAVIGMSGGVDSSVAALLLKRQGYDVIGITMQIWPDDGAAPGEGSCCGYSAAEDARRVAAVLDIPHYVMDFREEFREHVIDYFVSEYRSGRTPNPCIACNRYVKWEALRARALSLGAEYIATGHYARIVRCGERLALAESAHSAKDQTYALYSLTQEQLAGTLFPAGGYTKDEIRHMAEEAGLPVYRKPDSQEICFVPDGDYAGFIRAYSGEESPEGNYVDAGGNVLGRHRGITHYTVGQRKGLGVTFGEPRFVAAIRPETNEVVLGRADEVYSKSLYCRDLNWMAVDRLREPEKVTAKIRYNHRGQEAVVYPEDPEGRVRVEFTEPARAVTPGQAAVFYRGNICLGGGVITG